MAPYSLTNAFAEAADFNFIVDNDVGAPLPLAGCPCPTSWNELIGGAGFVVPVSPSRAFISGAMFWVEGYDDIDARLVSPSGVNYDGINPAPQVLEEKILSFPHSGTWKLKYRTFSISSLDTSGVTAGRAWLIAYDYNDPALKGWWKFDESSPSTTASDSSGNGNTGSLDSGAGFLSSANCKINNCVGFDGLNDIVNVADSSSLDIIGDMTITAWVRPTDFTNTQMVIMQKGLTDCGNFHLAIHTGNLAMASSTDCNWNSRGPNSVLTAGVWQHVAAVLSGTTLKYYVNGQLKDTMTWHLGATDSTNLTLSKQTGLPGCQDCLKGRIDDARLYSRALSATEVDQLYKQGL